MCREGKKKFPISHIIPCKKYDIASHGNSMPFPITNRHKSQPSGPNPHQIPWLFHVIYPGFICFSCRNMTWILDKFKVQVMEFPWHLPRKWWDLHQIWCHFRTKPNCRQRDMKKSPSHFLQGYYLSKILVIIRRALTNHAVRKNVQNMVLPK